MELTKELAHSLFYEKDGILFWKKKEIGSRTNFFNKMYADKEAGGFDSHGYRRVVYKQGCKSTGTHRIIFLMHNGYLPEVVDHKNGKKSDNRIENLRAATAQTNNQNSMIARHNTSGVKGVSYSKKDRYWRCSLSFNNKTKEVAGFKTIEDAGEFMDLWRSLAHGEFANNGKWGQA
jgi:hypothetical protein